VYLLADYSIACEYNYTKRVAYELKKAAVNCHGSGPGEVLGIYSRIAVEIWIQTLDLLASWRREQSFQLLVCHVNHQGKLQLSYKVRTLSSFAS
jgi:hypothetical protein